MIFESITLKNFRQFKGENTYEFSTDKGITLIIANNGVGKTTFLQAFRYCFYGESPNYLKLPKANKILTNSIEDDITEFDKETLEVSVNFSNNNRKYIASRSKGYLKKNGRLIEDPDNTENFTISEYIPKRGFVPKSKEESDELIRRIMPPGLIHIYMFDGERMEKRVETQEYKEDLKESITSMLGLKKLERALDLIGNEYHSSKALGMIKSKLKGQDQSQYKVIEDDKKMDKQIESLSNENVSYNKNLKVKETELKKYKKHQIDITRNAKAVAKRESLSTKLQQIENNIQSYVNEGLPIATRALKNKLLLSQYYRFNKFLEKEGESNPFYQSLHIDTIKDILHRKECICGTPLQKGSEKYEKVESLKDFVLPHNNAAYLTKIRDKFNNTTEFKSQKEELESIKRELTGLKRQRRDKKNELKRISREIQESEIKELNESPQKRIDELSDEITELKTKIGTNNNTIESIEKQRRKHNKALQALHQNSQHNRNVNEAMDALRKISDNIKAELRSKQEEAREILEHQMNETLNDILQRNFKVFISEDFELEITENGISQTDILSTGQSVLVSLSFIDALLKTFDKVKGNDEGKQHGVLMDAALSNVDERYISRICESVLNNFDQLIFMSFKRQLRHEFYEGIKHNIGKVYHLQKTDENLINTEEKNIDDLDSFIHEIEGER